MWCVPPRRRHQLPTNQLTVGPVVSHQLIVSVISLHLNSDMSIDAHITLVVSSCFGVLRQYAAFAACCHVKHSRCSLSSIVIASKVDYCNVAFAGLARCELDRIQSVLNAAARLTAGVCKFDHVTPLLANLHWLCVPECIKCKLCVLVHRRLNSAASQYLTELVRPRHCRTWSRVVSCVQRPRVKS